VKTHPTPTERALALTGKRKAPQGDHTEQKVIEQWTLEALARLAPLVLADLRDAPEIEGELTPAPRPGCRYNPGPPLVAPSATAWARRHYLDGPWFLDFAQTQRELWHRYPEHAATLRLLFGHGGTIVARSRADDEFMRAHTFDPPDPITMTMEHAVERTKAFYRARQAANKRESQGRRTWDTVQGECDWFVLVQVLGQRPAAVAREHRRDRSQVTKGWKRVASMLGVKLRPAIRGGRQPGARDKQERRERRDAL